MSYRPNYQGSAETISRYSSSFNARKDSILTFPSEPSANAISDKTPDEEKRIENEIRGTRSVTEWKKN
jgi:hypothetical protein